MTAKPHALVKRSVSLDGHRTSVALEQMFWEEIDALAERDHLSVSGLISKVDRERDADQNLASALRLTVLTALRKTSRD